MKLTDFLENNMENQEFEYIEVEVSRSEVTSVFLKVPKGYKLSGRDNKLIGRAAKETTSDCDWDNFGWENDLEIQSHKLVDAAEAEMYVTFDAIPYLKD